jgi:hypothetical protein
MLPAEHYVSLCIWWGFSEISDCLLSEVAYLQCWQELQPEGKNCIKERKKEKKERIPLIPAVSVEAEWALSNFLYKQVG